MTADAFPASFQATDLDLRCVNTIRFLAVDAVQKANSGHPGMPMGCAPMAYVLWQHHLKHDPQAPTWADRDRFVLSAGHGSMLIYALLHLAGYPKMTMDEIKAFRQWGSSTPGHPENFMTEGVETTTGPLGQGFGNGVGMAIAERFLAAHFNRDGFPVVDHHTYGIVSDGDLMEGISHEAASLAGHLGLGKLIYFYDDNEITIDGRTDLAFTEDVLQRFDAYGWHTSRIADGNDMQAIDAALRDAKADPRPSLIAVRTIIGYGSPNKQDTSKAHGSPLGPDEVELTKKNLGWPEGATFHVPDDVANHMDASERGGAAHDGWDKLFADYAEAHPDLARQFETWMRGDLEDGWEDALPTFEPGPGLATRASSGKVLEALGPHLGNLIGGSADLTGSNKTDIKGRSDFQKDNPTGRYFRFGVREHGMAAAMNGMVLHGGVRPYGGTFLIFSDYLRPSMRLSALMHQPVIYVFTHDSIGLGEDGPTHQPVEHHMALRAIPNLTYIRPGDANETAEAWRAALTATDGPTALALTRQKLPTLDRSQYGPADGLAKGAYVLSDDDGTPDVILIATGSEVALALEAADVLRSDGHSVRVVSMPSWELFEAQPQSYRDEVLPPDVTARVAIEAGVSLGWERYVGLHGRTVTLDRFGASAPAEVLFEKFGFSTDNVVSTTKELLG